MGRHRGRHRDAVRLRQRRDAGELPNDTVYLDGDPIPLGKGGTFVGQHIFTAVPGVMVQINAFNFPVWGMLEKLAPGVPGRRCRAS